MGVHEKDPLAQLSLPPGFRFYPTDEELLVQYLCRKVAGCEFSLQIIGEIDLYKFDPWVLPGKATFGEREWYFFSPRDRKYPNGSRPNRVAGSGYWKATGTDKMIMTQGRKVGIKKALVFYVGKAPKGNKTNWIMHEYRLIEPSKKNGSSKLDEWVLCRIYKKNSANSAAKTMSSISSKENSTGGSPSSATSSRLDGVLEPLPEIDNDNLPRVSSLKTVEHQRNDNFTLQRLESGNFDWSVLAGLTQLPELGPTGLTQQQGNMNVRNDVCVPSLPRLTHMDGDTVDDEVQSGLTAQRINDRVNSGYFYDPSLNGLTQGLSDPIDPFGIRYPNQQVGYGYGYEKIANRSIYWNSQNH